MKGFRAAYVFDVEQTDGRPLPAFAATHGDPKEFADKLKAFVAEGGIALTYDASMTHADGVSTGGAIRLRAGLTPAEEFSTLTHELAHEMLHHGPDRGEFTKVVRETQAEAVAFVVSRGIGLETGSAAADYIALYNGDDKTLAQSLSAIQETSSAILRGILPREPESPERTSGSRSAEGRGERQEPGRDDVSRVPRPTGPDPSDGIALER